MTRLEIDFLTEYDDASLLAELRRVATASGSDTVPKADLKRIGRVSHSAIVRHFGSLRRALQLAGLKSARFMKAADEELIHHRKDQAADSEPLTRASARGSRLRQSHKVLNRNLCRKITTDSHEPV